MVERHSGTMKVVVSIPLLFLGMMIGLVPVVAMWALFIIVMLVFGIYFILGRLA